MASLADAEGGNTSAAAPPASKHAVKALVKETLSEERLQQLGGGGTECAVCRCVLACMGSPASVFSLRPVAFRFHSLKVCSNCMALT